MGGRDNYLVANRPEVVGSEIDDLVQLLLQSYSIRVIGVCEVISRVRAPFFNTAAPILNQYLHDVLELRTNVFFAGSIWALVTLQSVLTSEMAFT